MASLVGRAVLAVTDRSAVRSLFTKTRPGRALSTRFVAGETLDQAVAAARALNDKGAQVSLDHLGEHVTDRTQAAAARDDYLACLDEISRSDLDANVSVKLTQLGMGLDDGLAAESLTSLAERAATIGTTVTVDMEESRYTDATIGIYEKVQSAYGNLGLAVQAYLLRTRYDLDRLIPLGGHIRLCKGAYAEDPQIAHQGRHEVDRSFDSLLHLLMAADQVKPAIATHDDERIAVARRLAASREGPYEYQMLYGVRTALQDELLEEGLPVRVYVPYGVAWYPYLTRRLAERPANLAFFLRAAISR